MFGLWAGTSSRSLHSGDCYLQFHCCDLHCYYHHSHSGITRRVTASAAAASSLQSCIRKSLTFSTKAFVMCISTTFLTARTAHSRMSCTQAFHTSPSPPTPWLLVCPPRCCWRAATRRISSPTICPRTRAFCSRCCTLNSVNNLKSLKQTLRSSVLQSAAFDSSLFARELERGLRVFWEAALINERHMNVKVAAVKGEI